MLLTIEIAEAQERRAVIRRKATQSFFYLFLIDTAVAKESHPVIIA